MGDALAVTYWPGGTPEPETAALDAADLVVIYGDARTVKSLRSRTPPEAAALWCMGRASPQA
jgi:hypothetical protein